MSIRVNMNTCKFCGKSVHKRKIYCNNSCQKYHEYTQYIYQWKLGSESGLRGKYQISSHIRRYLLEKYQNKCSSCGWCEVNVYTNNIPLEIDHIDGNYLNNNEGNLRLLCPNCHSLTSTYKNANAGNGRKERSKYNQ